MTHKSYDRLTHEHHVDDFNIDFLRYFKIENLIGNFFGSMIGILVFFYFSLHETVFRSNDFTFNLYIGGVVGVFICFTAIAKMAGNSTKKAVSIAGKRGLYTFVFMNMFLLVAIILSGEISLSDTFEKFIFLSLAGQIVVATFAVPFDLIATMKS